MKFLNKMEFGKVIWICSSISLFYFFFGKMFGCDVRILPILNIIWTFLQILPNSKLSR
jgi:hypothetical protein